MDISEDMDMLATFQIASFFRQHDSLTRNDCDYRATAIAKGQVVPTLLQGQDSYTVVASDGHRLRFIQFRKSALDIDIIYQARRTYGAFVPKCEFCGMLSDLYIYEMSLGLGSPFSRARRQFLAPGMEQRLLRTVQSFARFFALAWKNRLGSEQPPELAGVLLAQYSKILDQLSQGLPDRFRSTLGEVRRGLPLLFRPHYPMVLQHDDLLEMNVYLDMNSGQITGIVDWADAKASPFGTALGVLEIILGVQNSSRWVFHPAHDLLRAKFWSTFYDIVGYLTDDDRRAIEVGRVFGLFRTHGFVRRTEEGAVPLVEGDRDLMCLEAFCLPWASRDSFRSPRDE